MDHQTYALIREDNTPDNSNLTEAEMDAVLNDLGVGTPQTEDAEYEEVNEPLTHEEQLAQGIILDDEEEEEESNDTPPQPESPAPQTPAPEQEDTAPEQENKDLIPLNSPSLLVDSSTSRFSGASWYEEIQKSVIILAGVGGIGSNLAFQLARVKPASIFLYDDDIVEAANMSGQLFSKDNIGSYKTDAITATILSFTNASNVYSITNKFTSSCQAADIMMCGFDNMKARRTFFESWCKHVLNKPLEQRYNCLFLDGRLSIDTLQVFAITGNDIYNRNRYAKEFLFSDYQADHTECSLKQTTYMACMIASVMTNMFVNFTANKLNPAIPYDLPFFTEYDSTNVLFKTQR